MKTNPIIEKLKLEADIPVISGQWDYNDREVLVNDNGEWRPATPSEIIDTLFRMEKGLDKFTDYLLDLFV